MIMVVMGVSGSGKTTVGTMLAGRLGCPFLEGDALHPKENIEKMTRGIPLTDSDRAPWLTAIREHMLSSWQRGEDLVVACSALKEQYREFLGEGLPVVWLYLKASPELIRQRLEHRQEHYMKANMLQSQFDILEEPSDAIVADAALPAASIVQKVLDLCRNEKKNAASQAKITH